MPTYQLNNLDSLHFTIPGGDNHSLLFPLGSYHLFAHFRKMCAKQQASDRNKSQETGTGKQIQPTDIDDSLPKFGVLGLTYLAHSLLPSETLTGPEMAVHAYSPALGRLKQENKMFRVAIYLHIVILWSSWDTGYPVSRKKQTTMTKARRHGRGLGG